jgi:hypothetical protein
MKEGKQQDKELEEYYFKNGNREDFTPVISSKYSIHMSINGIDYYGVLLLLYEGSSLSN